VIASWTSCRHQISELSEARPMHMAELLAAALPTCPSP
jgi:Fe-S oxidoreductase